MNQHQILTLLPAQALDDAQLDTLIEHLVPRLAGGMSLTAAGVEIRIAGELAQTVTAMVDFELRALQRLRAQGMQAAKTAAQ
jgi:hypothetical protein